MRLHSGACWGFLGPETSPVSVFRGGSSPERRQPVTPEGRTAERRIDMTEPIDSMYAIYAAPLGWFGGSMGQHVCQSHGVYDGMSSRTAGPKTGPLDLESHGSMGHGSIPSGPGPVVDDNGQMEGLSGKYRPSDTPQGVRSMLSVSHSSSIFLKHRFASFSRKRKNMQGTDSRNPYSISEQQ